MKRASSITRRSALGLLGLGAVGGAVYGLSRSEVLALLKSDAEAPEDFRVVRRPYPSEPGREVSILGYGGIRLPILNRREEQIDEGLPGRTGRNANFPRRRRGRIAFRT